MCSTCIQQKMSHAPNLANTVHKFMSAHAYMHSRYVMGWATVWIVILAPGTVDTVFEG